MIAYLLISVTAFGGFGLAFTIWRSKRTAKPLVCLIGADCDKVVRSSYSSLFGIPNEVLGMAYYGLIGVSYGLLVAEPSLAPDFAIVLLRTATAAAAVFSVILAGIQAFVLREWCEWCLASSVLSLVIFGLAWF